jgi:hypothetical protein
MKETLKILLKRNLKPVTPWFLFRFFMVIIVVLSQTTVVAQVAQRITINGTVFDGTSNEPMAGVNIVIQGTTTGTTTDISGKFSIIVPGEQTILVFTFIGYTQQSVTVGKQRQLTIALKSDLLTIDEVVIVGYGVQKKESVVGAVTQASGQLIKSAVQGADLGNALTGQLPGLVTISTTGVPGGSDQDDDYALMYIRGQKTWNNASPLVLSRTLTRMRLKKYQS